MTSYQPFHDKSRSQDDLTLASEEEYHETPKPKTRRFRLSTVLLSLSTLVFGAHSLYTLTHPSHCEVKQCEVSSFDKGYKTDWEPPKAAIELEIVKYGGSIKLNETTQDYYREIDPTKPQYAGKPSEEIDKAWADLLKGQYLLLSEEEAMKLDDPVTIQGQYIAEVEVMHSLHCLNTVRMALDPEYYKVHKHHHTSPILEKVNEIHIAHCIEQLRQSIQCNSDLTPLLLRPYGQGDNALLIGAPQVHTCRNWDKFRSWYSERGERSGAIDASSV